MLVSVPRSWECSFPGAWSPARPAVLLLGAFPRCQQVTALHHCHRAAAATEAQPWLMLNRSRTWGKAVEKLKASGISGLASVSLLPEVTLRLVAPQPRARSDPRACPGVPVPDTALGWPVGIPGWWGQDCAHLSSPQAVLGDPPGHCSRAAVFPGTETSYKLPQNPDSLKQNKPWGVHSRAAVSSLSPSTCQTRAGCWSSLCNLLQPGTDASAELRASSAALHVQREGRSIPLGNKKVSWSFSSPSFPFQPSP